ncbi:30S ribosomal protein S7 [bacterium]|nr:30S ribosomal protein S7 [bacterium]
MPRRKGVPKRDVISDSKYNSKLVAKFINCLMHAGKKSVAESILYRSFDILEQKVNEEPLNVFRQAINNVKPLLELRPRRVGGTTYQVPLDVRSDRRNALAIRWIINSARDRGEKAMHERLANELIEASKNEGASIKQKTDMHRMAEANRAFAHYRW